uniref:Uncharacterized protein n=1 Tax=Chromera velia CCMP2878 TaxID=1169474 RepID=A0A0G4HV56_9ALVE|eukprot:Cvel_32128.t1-p1 / transcript=Cvel_32128.t1 / gene=Cvel_32128 / organism=Chromera_velia_CCMP2878 / gene_product=hypothetical protein / transcript_product=hypothetical protein / location=Cvel_scaffold4922:3636-4406(+) / protein_length=221 / sequence_SO=supercontig / SO=protein_coding / is_pseudo=false
MNVLHASRIYCGIVRMRESFPLPALNFATQQHHNTVQQYPLLPHQNSVSSIAQNASHVPFSRPVSGVQPSQAPVIPSGLPQQHAQPQAAPLGSPAQQAPEGILSSPPRATDAAAATIPLEALVSPDEGGPSAPRTDGGKNRKRMMSGRETRSPGQGGERMGRKILEEEDAVRMRGRMLYRTFQAAGEGFLGFRETPVGLPPQGWGGVWPMVPPHGSAYRGA